MNSTINMPSIQGKRIHDLRLEHDMRVEELGFHAQLSVAQIYRLERSERPNVSALTLGKIASVLNTSIEFLMGMTDDARSLNAIIEGK